MPEEFFILLIAHAGVDKYQPVAILNEQATQGPAAHIIIVGVVYFIPNAFGHYAEHGAAVQFEIAGIDRV
jgi:hypothetical protein